MAGSLAPAPYPIKVVLWNIHGKTEAGYPQARKDIVPPVIESVNPDILLLQETCDRPLVKSIMKLRSETREYRDVQRENVRETRIMYDAEKYDSLLATEKNFPHGKSLNDVLCEAKQEIFTTAHHRTKLRESKNPVFRSAFEQRISIAVFRKRDSSNSPKVIFISFHNFNLSEGVDVRARCVEGHNVNWCQ